MMGARSCSLDRRVGGCANGSPRMWATMFWRVTYLSAKSMLTRFKPAGGVKSSDSESAKGVRSWDMSHKLCSDVNASSPMNNSFLRESVDLAPP